MGRGTVIEIDDVPVANQQFVGTQLNGDVRALAAELTMAPRAAANLAIWILLLVCPTALSDKALERFSS